MEEYNWKLILPVSIPVGLIEAYVFYSNMPNLWKYFLLLIGLLLAFWIIYTKEKSKKSIFTASCLILLFILVEEMIKKLGLF